MNKYNFTVKGDGQNILIVHGWGGTIKSLENLQNHLSKYYKVYSLELPGHGDSPQMENPWFMRDFSDYVEGFLNATNLRNIVYIGHSFGGKIGLDLSINKEVISKLILIDASGIKPKNSLKKFVWGTVAKILTPISDLKILHPFKTLFYKFVIRERDYSKTSGNLKATFRNIVEEHYDNLIDKITIPTLIIWGESDSITPLYMAHKLNKKIKNSFLKTFQAGHGLPLIKPDVVGDEIKKWLS